jgi:UDP-N-acetylmuramate dehydrogenase
VTIPAADLSPRYRATDLPTGWIVTAATFAPPPGEPAELAARMADQIARRNASQPVDQRTAGSTFRNPAGFSSTGRGDHGQERMAWRLIDEAGLRGARIGGAQMSEKHANFLVNTGGATAADLEALGEHVRKTVLQRTGISLDWEIMRVGEPIPDQGAHKKPR